jgi:hypothetical protein
MGLSFTIAAGPRQRSHSQVRFPRDSWQYLTLSDLRLHPPWGPDPRIYITVMSLGTGFAFRFLLRLPVLRCRFSTPPPHGVVVFWLLLWYREFRWEIYPRWVDWSDGLSETCGLIPCISCMWCLVPSARPSLLSNIFCCRLRTHVGLILIFKQTLSQVTFVLLNACF